MATRLTRVERKERTRDDLVAAARSVFLRRGFHGASLDEIAEEAGYTKGAIYSNFAGKDELFLAVLDAHFEQRARAYTGIALDDAATLDGTVRAVARFMVESDAREPDWAPLLLEFWVHASRQDDLRRAAAERRHRFLELVAGLIAQVGRRHGVGFRLSPLEVARGSGALARGMAVERLLDPSVVSTELFEEMHAAYMTGLTTPGPDDARDGSNRRTAS